MAGRKWERADGPEGRSCTVFYEGKALAAKEGEPLMVTLLAHGVDTASRSVKYHRPRGAFCMAGSCGQCWMRIDDLPNRAACTTPSIEGRATGRQNAFPSADVDLFRAADIVFSDGFDHHRLATTPLTPLNAVMQGTARQMAGLGSLSERPPESAARIGEEDVDLVVVGSGPAGLSAALAAASAGVATLLVESRARIGGQLRLGLFDDHAQLGQLCSKATRALDPKGLRIWCNASALGLYADERGRSLLLRRRDGEHDRLAVLRPRRLLLATGGYEQCPLFAGNDLPGHYGARALAELLLVHGVLPGTRVAVLHGGSEIGPRLSRALAQRGIEHHDVDMSNTEVLRARGRARVKGLELAPRDRSKKASLTVDLIASACPPAPAFELAQQAGCAIRFAPERGFVVQSDPATGATAVPGIWAAGELCGTDSAEQSMAAGERAGRAIALAKNVSLAASVERRA